VADFSSLQEFVARFVAPLVKGGRVHVEGLLGPGVFKSWLAHNDLDASLVASITKVMHDNLARVGPVGSADQLPFDAIALAAVWHNLLAMTHPEARASKGLRKRVKTWSTAMLEWIDAPRTRAEVAYRHGVLGRLGELGRVDTTVTFWAGYATFLGVAPPSSLMAWPNLRRVREEKLRVDLFELVKGLEPASAEDMEGDLYPAVRAALALSPLTDVSLADRPAAVGFTWSPSTVNAMGDACLRGAAERAVLGRGPAAVRAVEQATLAAVRNGATPKVARLLLKMHLEMLALDALSARPHGVHSPEGARAGAGSTATNAASLASSSPTLSAQTVAMDAYVRLGAERVAAITGAPLASLQRSLPIDPSRPVPKDPPSALLIARAGVAEVRS
jgi:hypothetical protein